MLPENTIQVPLSPNTTPAHAARLRRLCMDIVRLDLIDFGLIRQVTARCLPAPEAGPEVRSDSSPCATSATTAGAS